MLCRLMGVHGIKLDNMSITPAVSLDDLDRRLLRLLGAEPRVGVLAASRRLGVARGTVQARLDRLERVGVLASWAPALDPEALGFTVTAFVTLEIRQGVGHDAVATHLSAIPEVLEAHTITGSGDLLARLVARSNTDLQRVLDLVTGSAHVERSSTVIALSTAIAHRVQPLLDA